MPDECDSIPDTDGDRLHDCEDLCPLTNPIVACVCNEVEDCCFPDGWCYSDMGLPPIPPADCELQGGTPACFPSPLCRRGCLVGDVDDDGEIDMKDVAGMQRCFGIEAGEDGYAECTRVFDCGEDCVEDGVVDLRDYKTLEDLLYNGAS